MSKIKDFLQTNKRYETIIKGLIALFFPLLLCVIYCAVQGKTIGQVYLPESEWNDELFYFKQVEGIVNFGFPQGYFGFDESHAKVLSFAAWSPVLVFPWIIWGVIFGWNLLSPIICNIVLLGLACMAFVLLTKPNVKQMITLGVMMSCFVIFERYMLSTMPEIICFSMVILFSALAYNTLLDDRIYKIIILFVLSAIMTLMRPYLLLFMILPIFIFIRKKKVLGAVISAAILLVTLGAYACIKKFLGADYFTPLFSMNWLTDFLKVGFIGGLKNLFYRIYTMTYGFFIYSINGIKNGNAPGEFFVIYVVMTIVFTVQFVLDLVNTISKRKNAKNEKTRDNQSEEKSDKNTDNNGFACLVLEGHFLLALLGMFAALILMYKLEEGSKHLLTFIAGGIFVLVLLNNKTYIKYIVMAICFVFFFFINASSAYDYKVPFANEATIQKQEAWKTVFEEEIRLTDNAPSFDNVVIWNWRANQDGNPELMKWQRLYSLPAGCGINCCNGEYIINNIDSIQSKYITTLAGSDVDLLLNEKGYEKIYSDDEVAFYKMH